MELNSRIFIAGHQGMLGSSLVRNLESQGHSHLLQKTSKELDLREKNQVWDFFKTNKPEFVFLAAAKVGGIQANIESMAEFLYENLQIQNNVIEASRVFGVKKLLFVASSCIYPKLSESPIAESAFMKGPIEPTNEGYGLAKIVGVKMCQYYRKQYGVDFISTIPSNLFGINDHYDEKRSHLLPALILKIHNAKKNNDKEILLWGSGKPRREFMISDDCADALTFLMKNYSSSEPVNVGTGVDHSVDELALSVGEVLGHRFKIIHDSSRPDGMMRKLTDVDRLTKLGWKKITPLTEGIKIAYHDFLERGLG